MNRLVFAGSSFDLQLSFDRDLNSFAGGVPLSLSENADDYIEWVALDATYGGSVTMLKTYTPEPSSVVLLGVGVLALEWFARHRACPNIRRWKGWAGDQRRAMPDRIRVRVRT